MELRLQKMMNSYMQMCLHINKEEKKYLRIPTVWDNIEKQWIGFIQTPISNTLISGKGKDTFELQNDFNKSMNDIFSKNDEVSKELYEMFMPDWFWDKT